MRPTQWMTLGAAMFVAGIMLLAAGVPLFWFGWRGRRVDDHPLCRECGFDLIGLDAKVCPECGKVLQGTHNVVCGHRQRRVGLAIVGLTLVAIGAGSGAAGAVAGSRGVDWYAAKPDWVLEQEALSSETPTRALVELTGRMPAGDIGQSRTTALVGHALSLQGDLDCTWDRAWGDLIEAGWQRGLVSSPQWSTYLRQGFPVRMGVVSPALRVAPVAQGRHPMDEYRRFFEVVVGPARLGSKILPGLTVKGEMMGVQGRGTPRLLEPYASHEQRPTWPEQRLRFAGCVDDLSDSESLDATTCWVFRVLHGGHVAASWQHSGHATGFYDPHTVY